MSRLDLAQYLAPKDWKVEDYDRSQSLGGSEVAKACGLLPPDWERATPEDLAAEKLGNAPAFEGNEKTFWGNKLEPVVAQVYAEKTGHELHRLRTIRSEEHPWASCTPDRWVVPASGEDFLLQIKCTRFLTTKQPGLSWGEPGSDVVPRYVAAQCAWEMLLTGRSRCDVAVLVGGSEFRLYTVRRSEELERLLFKTAQNFWFTQVVPHRKAA